MKVPLEMKTRIQKLHTVAVDIPPGICRGMECNPSCPLWNIDAKRHDDFCLWLIVKDKIDAMYEKVNE